MQNKRADQRTYHFIYKTTCVVTGKWYIGMHSTDDLKDGYVGSGTHLWRSIKIYGKENHHCEILEHLPDRKSLALREEAIVTTEMCRDPMCMNMRTGGTGNYPGKPTSEETGKKITEANIKRWAREKRERAEANSVAPFTMTREQILAELLFNGSINKNVKRNLRIRAVPSRSREAAVARKWNCIYTTLQSYHGETAMDRVLTYVSAPG